MRRSKLLCSLVVFVLMLVIGCENNLNDITLDEMAIEDYILNDIDFAGYFSFYEYYGEKDTVSAEVRLRQPYITGPHTWYREPQDINREISIDIVDDSAFVSFESRVDGVFHILEIDTFASPDTVIDHQKELIDISYNYAIFKRYDGVSAYRGWVLENLTGVKVNTYRPLGFPDFVTIDSLRINCESYQDTLFADPFVFFGRDELLTFGMEKTVTITIYASCEIDLYAYLHANSMGHWRRCNLEEIETRVWQGDWVTPLTPGIRAVAFDVLTKESIDGMRWSCEANIWLFPYRVE